MKITLNRKKHILIFIDWYLPGYRAGGPIQSCANLVSHLKPYYNFSIVTRNTDFGETKPYTGIKFNEWITIDESLRIFYLSNDRLKPGNIKFFFTEEYDALYLNSLFSVYFTLFPLWLNKTIKKIIVAPRGMFGSGALSIKPLKKKLFLKLAQITGLYSKVVWHASTPLEADEIKAVLGNETTTVVALNLPPSRELTFAHRTKEANKLKLFFLSRISPKKNLLAVFRFLKLVNKKYMIKFDIIGPVEDASYWKQCLNEISVLKNSNPNIEIQHLGAFENAELLKKLYVYHCLILPTLNENFGHAIVDALASGCAVILSDQTPWRGLAGKMIGWDLPLKDEDKFVVAIETMAAMDQESFNKVSLNAFNEANSFYNNKDIVSQNVEIFR